MSSYYGIVFPEFWTGDTGRAIQSTGGKDAQILALYLMSCRHATMIGLYSLPMRDVRHETGLGLRAFVRAVAALTDAQFSNYDAGTEHVWVREMAKFRLGLQKKSPLDVNDKRVTGVQTLYEKLADNPFLEPFFDRYAREVRLKRRRSCGLTVIPPQDVAPSKGLLRGFQGAWKPVNRSTGISTEQESGIRDQGSGKSTAASRRSSLPSVENTEGTRRLYCVIAREARDKSLSVDQSDSISNIAEHFKTLCAERHLTYSSDLATDVIASVMKADERRPA